MKQYVLYNPMLHKIKFRDIKELENILNTSDIVIFSRLSKKQNYFKKMRLYVFKDYDPKKLREIYKTFKHPIEGWVRHDEKYSCSTDGRIKKHLKTKDIILIPFRKKGRKNPDIRYIKTYGKETKVSRFIKSTFEKRIINKNESVHHLDGDQYNNSPDNLIIMSKEKLGRRTGGNSRSVPVALIDEIGNVLREYASIRKAAKDNFVSYQTINDYLNGKTKSAAGMKFIKTEQS